MVAHRERHRIEPDERRVAGNRSAAMHEKLRAVRARRLHAVLAVSAVRCADEHRARLNADVRDDRGIRPHVDCAGETVAHVAHLEPADNGLGAIAAEIDVVRVELAGGSQRVE